MKRLLLTFALLLTMTTVMAVPAKSGIRKTLTLKNGSRVEATLVGDEYVHYYQTDDRRCIQHLEGSYQFVNRDSLLRLHSQRLAERNRARIQRAAKGPRKVVYEGQRRGLVIMVEFSDVKFTYDRETFEDFFNKVGFNQDGMRGSVHDYFLEQSYGRFDLEFDIVGPITMTQKASYYANSYNRIALMVNSLCRQVDKEVDFGQYDWNGDGSVDQVYVVYAGYGSAQGAENTIWPHEWSVLGATNNPYLTAEGVYIGTYGISCELMGDGKTDTGRLDGIGTSCHEFSHCLGLPDFYDTAHNDENSTGGNFGMGNWSLMDAGCYNGSYNGRSPSGYTAYERWECGWLEPVELNNGRHISDMPPIQEEPVAYVVYNDANHNEYYLLANHQKIGFDKSAFGHGMLVLHVDYDAAAWLTNTVNSEEGFHRMTIIPADNALQRTSVSMAADPFPGTRMKRNLTNTSTPQAVLNNENLDGQRLMSKPITAITESGGLISFDFMGGMELETPLVREATGITATGFTANWDAVDGAVNYTVCLTKKVEVEDDPEEEEGVLLMEDFSGFKGLSSSLDDDISSQLDTYTRRRGWTGENLYAYKNLLRIGKSGAPGALYSPVVSPTQKAFTVLISPSNAAASGTTSLNIFLNITSGGTATAQLTNIGTVASEREAGTWLMPVASWPYGDFSMAIQSAEDGEGVYLYYVEILDGYHTWDDLTGTPSLLRQPRKAQKSTETLYQTTETSYTFADLDPEAQYSYKVRANVSNDTFTPWSDEMKVELSTTIRSFFADGPINVNAPIYMLDARRAIGTLRPGLYIQGGRKFLVK